MAVSKEEILHIAKLADLKIEENEIDEYAKNLEEILDFMKVLDSVNTDNVEESIGTLNNINVFRKEIVTAFVSISFMSCAVWFVIYNLKCIF